MFMTVTLRGHAIALRRSAVALVLAGCVLSVDPVVPESDGIFDPGLLGTWEEVGGTDRAVVERASGNSYAIVYTSDDTSSRFEGWLDSLGGRLVMNVRPQRPPGAVAGGLLIPGQLLLILDVSANEVRIAGLEPDSLLNRLRATAAPLDHWQLADQLVLGGTTATLRQALTAVLPFPDVLTPPTVMRRIPGTVRAPSLAPTSPPCFEASAWREADLLFRRDRHWVGGDAASAVSLGGDRILWLFGDSWIDPTGRRTRHGARMISNSVAIQTGKDPATASITFHWRRMPDGTPAPIVPDHDGERHWFGNGIRSGDRLVLFLNRVRTAPNAIGFESVGWTAWMVENPDADPLDWRMYPLATPTNPLGVLVGFAAVQQLGDHVYAFGSQDPVKSHPIHVVRWTTEQVRHGELLHPEWWGGDRLGWVADSTKAARQPIFENGQSELSVHRDSVTGRFLAFHTQGFGAADVVVRSAPRLTGPWDAPRLLFRPSEYFRPNGMVYAAKAHPELTGGDLVLTYATNSFAFAEHLTDSLIYYPRFVRLTRCG